jgi:hypothetical protein
MFFNSINKVKALIELEEILLEKYVRTKEHLTKFGGKKLYQFINNIYIYI